VGRGALKIIGWVVAVLLVVVVASGLALYFGGGRAVAWALEHPVSGTIGRDIRLAHTEVDWGSWGRPTRLVMDDVHVANAPWGSAPDMFVAKRVEIAFYAKSLILAPTRIPLIALDNAKLLLETSKDGKRNWDFGLSSAAPKKRHQFPDLRRLTVTHSELTFQNGETGAHSLLEVAKLDFSERDLQEPVVMVIDGAFQKAPMHLQATIGPIAELRNTEKPYPFKFEGKVDQLRLAADGTVQEPLDVSGVDARLSLEGAKLNELATRLGVPLPELPDVKGTGKLTGGDGHWTMEALTLRTGKSDLEGGIGVDTTGKVPAIEANLTSSFIDMADFKGLYGGTPGRSSAPAKPADNSSRVLPDTAIAIHKLPGVNAKLSFEGSRIQSAGGLPVERIVLGLELRDGELEVKPLRLHTADGDIDLSLHFTPFTGPPHLNANLDIRHIDLHKLLDHPSMPAMLRETAGTAGGFAKIDTTGVSLRQFLGRMSGDAGFFLGNGQISALMEQLAPINVVGALGVYATGDHPVQINCMVSRFDIKQGVATATTFLVDTKDVDIVGKGNANFADETLDLNLTPHNKSFTIVSLRTPVDIGGTFAKPDYHVEAGGLIARLGAAVGLGVLFPPAALVPLIDTGLGEKNACSKAYAAQQPPGTPAPSTGSSTPPKARPEAPPGPKK
jgi:AsmA family protein